MIYRRFIFQRGPSGIGALEPDLDFELPESEDEDDEPETDDTLIYPNE